MKILVLCHDIPSSTFSDTLPVYHLVRYLHSEYNHDIKLICFDSGNAEADDNIKQFIDKKPVKLNLKSSIYKEFLIMFKNMFKFSNLKRKVKGRIFPNLLDYYYNSEMDDTIKSTLKKSEFDLIYLTRPMASYVTDLDIPKVIQPYDAVYKWHEQMYKSAAGFKKFMYFVLYSMTRYYEKNVYKKFDACLLVTDKDKEQLQNLNQDLNIHVVPNGVDTDYFKPVKTKEEFPSLIYVSNMAGSPTTENVLHFHDNIFPVIREKVPEVKLYLVGRNPVKEIKDLSSDHSVIVTGFVEDVRPYLAKSSIFVAPMIMGTGIKNKVLEAMSMGKSVVSTEIGAQGIDASNSNDIFVTDNEKLFAEYVLKLLDNEPFRKNIGINARILMEKKYSWLKVTEKLNSLFLDLIKK